MARTTPRKILYTVLAITVLIAMVLYMPWWVQGIAFVIAVVIVPYRLSVLVPALIADAWYAPDPALSFSMLKTTLFVSVVLVIYWIIMTQTRVRHVYAMEKN